ncbi:translin-associated factor X-interacting protein 1 isoform X2 [Heptranchias perlo]|uniref:translin-associated factor X-interacting protein 1 isoform X2 n=1 Tax=Heptranchias perlo TaxID=212740 RepID=UPI00355994E6
MSTGVAGRLKTLAPIQRGASSKSNVTAPAPACLTYQLQGSDIRYHLPLKQLLPSVETNAGYLSSWPGHISGEIVQPKQKHQPSNVDKHHRFDDAYTNKPPKPRFLEQLETHLRKELQVLDLSGPNAQEVNLQAYREVFEYFIEDLKTYKPLLSAIKNEYEITLAHLRNRIRELEPLKSMLVATSENCEQRIVALREEEKFEIKLLRSEKIQLLQKVDQLMEMQDSLETQVSKLQEELAAEYERYREQHDARKLLISDMNNLRHQQEDSKDSHIQEVDAVDDTVKLKLALKVTRADLKVLQVQLNAMKAEYGDVVPRRDFEALDKNYNELTEKNEILQKHFSQLKQEYSTLFEVNKQVTHQRDKLSAEVELFKTTMAGGLSLSQMSDIQIEVDEDYFEGLGTGEDVIVYLRQDGLVKNVNLSKEDITSVLKEIWKEKITADLQSGTRSNLPEFFHKFLQKKYGDSALHWAYNIFYGCRNHPTDETISLFFSILNGIVDESVYHGQMHLISHLLKELIHRDTSGKGILSKQEFRELTVAELKKAFQTIDPLMDPQTLATYLAQGFQITKEQLDQATAMDAQTVFDRLQASDIKRMGPRK